MLKLNEFLLSDALIEAERPLVEYATLALTGENDIDAAIRPEKPTLPPMPEEEKLPDADIDTRLDRLALIDEDAVHENASGVFNGTFAFPLRFHPIIPREPLKPICAEAVPQSLNAACSASEYEPERLIPETGL